MRVTSPSTIEETQSTDKCLYLERLIDRIHKCNRDHVHTFINWLQYWFTTNDLHDHKEILIFWQTWNANIWGIKNTKNINIKGIYTFKSHKETTARFMLL